MTCRSVQATVPAFHVVIFVRTPTTDADVRGCSRRALHQTRVVDVGTGCKRSSADLATSV